MLTPEEIAGLRDISAEITEPMTEWLIQDIAERISLAGKITSTAEYEIYRAQALGNSRKALKKMLKKQLGLSSAEIDRLFRQGAKLSHAQEANGFEGAVPFEQNGSLQQMVNAAAALAKKDFTNLTQTLGMVAPNGKAYPIQKVYQQCMDYAFKQVFTGSRDYVSAVRDATKNLAEQGLQVIEYQSGVHTSIEAATRRCMLGGMGLMVEKISQYNHDELGCDGWEISAHANSAPDHEDLQGRQYSDAEYKRLNESLQRRIGTLNCGHAAFPILLGINSPQYTPDELEAFKQKNAEGITYQGRHYTGYEATQKQRRLEVAQRNCKRRILAAEASGDDAQMQTQQIRLRRVNEEYKAFSDAAGLRTRQNRLEVAGWLGKDSRSAVSAEKKVEKQRKDDILKESIRSAGTLQKSAIIHLNPAPLDVETLSFDDKHINIERGHNVTKEQALQWIHDAKISVSVWNGQFERYYGIEGTVYINIVTKSIRTAYAKDQYSEALQAMMEVILKNGL